MIDHEPHADLRHFTFRELLAQRALARRALRRGCNRAAAHALIAAIDAALETRRKRIFDKRSASAPGAEF